mgnify:CR=1 FL=1
MYLTEKPSDWTFELQTPTLGEEGATSTGYWEKMPEASVLYDGQVFDFREPLKAEAWSSWTDEGLAVSIRVQAFLSSPCSRCLEPADIEILNDFMYLYTLRKEKRDDRPSEEDETQVVIVDRWRNFLDISDQVWESLILSLPLRVLCMAGCRGLCPVCGKSLNHGQCGCSPEKGDPRMEGLLGFLG